MMKSEEGNIYYGDLAIYVFKKQKRLIVLFVVIATIASVVISLLIPNEYTAKANAVPPKTSASSLDNLLGGITSTLRDIGLAKLGGKGESIYSFLVILDSRAVKDSIIKKYRLDTVYNIPMTKMTKLRKAFEQNLEITLEVEGNYYISFTDRDPRRAADIVNDYVEISNYVAQQVAHEEARFSRNFIEKRLEGIEATLNQLVDSLQRYSKEYLIFSPMEQAKAISSSYAELKATKIAQEVIYDMLKMRYGENDPLTLSQKSIVDNLRSKLYEFENKPGYVGNFPLTKAAKVSSDYLRLYSDIEAFLKVKAFLLPVLEEMKLNEVRQYQSLIFLDRATPPDQKSRPKRSLIVLGTFFGSFVLIWFSLMAYYRVKFYLSKVQMPEFE